MLLVNIFGFDEVNGAVPAHYIAFAIGDGSGVARCAVWSEFGAWVHVGSAMSFRSHLAPSTEIPLVSTSVSAHLFKKAGSGTGCPVQSGLGLWSTPLRNAVRTAHGMLHIGSPPAGGPRSSEISPSFG